MSYLIIYLYFCFYYKSLMSLTWNENQKRNQTNWKKYYSYCYYFCPHSCCFRLKNLSVKLKFTKLLLHHPLSFFMLFCCVFGLHPILLLIFSYLLLYPFMIFVLNSLLSFTLFCLADINMCNHFRIHKYNGQISNISSIIYFSFIKDLFYSFLLLSSLLFFNILYIKNLYFKFNFI